MQPRVLRANLIRHIREQQLFDATDHVLVAVSGGQDSLRLLRWLTEGDLPQDLQPKVSAIYINHQLRSDASQEEALVRQVFAQTPHLQSATVRTLDWAAAPTVSVEEQAREKRYGIMFSVAKQVGANMIVTAHHRDDQVETILYKLARGSRLEQLTGMPAKQNLTNGLQLVRPFLGLSKMALKDIVKEPVQEWIDDYTNDDQRYARNRLRHAIIPDLQHINKQAMMHIIDFADQLTALQALAAPQIDQYVVALETGQLDWELPQEQLLLVLQQWLKNQQVLDIKDRQLQQAIQLMKNKNVATGTIHLNDHQRLIRDHQWLSLVKS
ncbi:tRNA lysidine(34) synthetase TilS [Weissella fangxianensis]|uniref:tRNA lysidine(34) synthetase TilS n=1 Tax=Weissella fangxianensis TaxID=2953879 RepID=UPI0021576E72|nr:tRNA lysidine(34) synthetase TilS [Weissella fangxianensis]